MQSSTLKNLGRPIFLAGSTPGTPQRQRIAESLELLEKPPLLFWKKTILGRFEIPAQFDRRMPSVNAGVSREFPDPQHRLAQILGTNSRNIVCCDTHQTPAPHSECHRTDRILSTIAAGRASQES
jgi:hypothetical protein